MIFVFVYAEILVLVSRANPSGLFCSSKNIFEDLQDVTPYCVITGSNCITISDYSTKIICGDQANCTGSLEMAQVHLNLYGFT